MKMTQMQQIIVLGALLFVGVVFLYYLLLLKPLNAKIDTAAATLKTDQDKLALVLDKIKNYAQFKKEADSIQRELEWYQNRIPKTVDNSKLLEAITFAQSRSGVVLTSLQFQPLQSPKDYTEVPAIIRFNSDFNGLMNFLYQTSTSNLFMTVRDLMINPASFPGHPNFTIQVQLTVSGIEAKQ